MDTEHSLYDRWNETGKTGNLNIKSCLTDCNFCYLRYKYSKYDTLTVTKYRLWSIVVNTDRKCVVGVVYNVKTHFRYLYNKTDALIFQIYSGTKLYMFRAVPLPIIRSLFTVHSALAHVIQVWRELSSRTILWETSAYGWFYCKAICYDARSHEPKTLQILKM